MEITNVNDLIKAAMFCVNKGDAGCTGCILLDDDRCVHTIFAGLSNALEALTAENEKLKDINKALESDNYNLNMNLEHITAELAELREAQRWIPVSERLPEESGKYLVFLGKMDSLAYGKCAHVAWFYGGSRDFGFSLNSGLEVGKTSSVDLSIVDITHWRKLPAPPQKGE